MRRQPAGHLPPIRSALVSQLDRLVPLEHAFNLRDIGGYRTGDGRSVRTGVLWRADGLHRLRGADLEVVRRLGLRTVIDLRTDDEVAAGRFPVEDLPVAWHHHSVMDVTWSSTQAPAGSVHVPQYLAARYREMLDLRGDQFAAALRVLAAPGALPAVFHCAAGKDRTGVLAALVLSGLGVDDDDVVADYALSTDAINRLRTWADASHPELAARMAAQPAAHLAADADAMRLLLGGITERYGSTAGQLAALGIGPDVLDALAGALLTD